MSTRFTAFLQLLIRRPLIVYLGIALILVGGMASFRKLPTDLFPELDYPLFNIVTQYPGATAEDVEVLVTRPLENALGALPGLRRLRSASAVGFSQVTAEFAWGSEVTAARQLVQSAIAQASPALPAGTAPELENIGSSLRMISTYTLSGGQPPEVLRDWLEYEAVPALARLPGVAAVRVMGGGRRAFRVDLDPVRLRNHSLSVPRIIEAIQDANALGAGGVFEAHARDRPIEMRGGFRASSDVEKVMLKRDPEAGPLLLGDLARVSEGVMPERHVITKDRRPALAFIVQKNSGAGTLAVSRAVDSELARLTVPEGARIDRFYDQAEIIGRAYRNMRNQLLIGALLAVAVLFWALGRSRVTFVVALSIPLSVIGAFLFMNLAGLGINLMTLGALTVTIGMLSDDAVLVLDNIIRHRDQGKGAGAAARDGVAEIFGADVAGTLTTVAAFAPLALLSGLAGRLLMPFGVTFALVLILSLVFSLTLIPWAAARWLRGDSRSATSRIPSNERFFSWLSGLNLSVLNWLLAHRVMAIGGSLGLLAGAMALLTIVPVRFLPLLDENSLLVSYQLAPGTALSESDRVGAELEALLLGQPGVSSVFRRTGSPENTFFIEGPDQGEMVVRLDATDARGPLEIRAALERALASRPGILTRVNEPTGEKLEESFSGLPALFGITVSGDSLDEIYAAARRVEDMAQRTEGVENVINNTKIPIDIVAVEFDRAAGARAGVSPRDVARTVRAAWNGVTATESVVQGRVVRVFVRYAATKRGSLIDLENVLVPTVNGDLIPLSAVATIKPSQSYPVIEHQFGRRALTMAAEVEGSPFAIIRSLNAGLAKLNLPPDIRVTYTGQYREIVRLIEQAVPILLIAALLVFAIAALQLGSVLDGAVVLVKLPIDFAGAAIALYLTGQALDLTVVIGFVALLGVAVNNGIVLLTFARDLRRRGLDAPAAIREAVKVRLRPMVLTYLTTAVALLPAALGLGQGPQMLQALGVMMIGGLTLGTILTLNLIPVVYLASETWRKPPVPVRAAEER